MLRVEIKPLSVNECWRGKRSKSVKYLQYQEDVFWMLPKFKLPEPPFEIYLRFGFSSASSDFDNPVKPFVDIMQKRYKFDDKHIKRAIIEVDQVKKGAEFIEFDFRSLKQEKQDQEISENQINIFDLGA